MNTTSLNISGAVLRRAATLSDKIAEQQAELASLLAGKMVARKATRKAARKTRVKHSKRHFTPAGLERIREGQRRRWAKAKEAAPVEVQTVAPQA